MTERNLPENQLAGESSLYLRQHAQNLVNWYPWGTYAIELARKHDKPILLSIGYSTCHWCHVMMHESFNDPEVAAAMNRLFVNIKVDKEERPDLDKIYQTAFQLLLGHGGGWPLTMFLSPHTLIPYFGGTYFPKKERDNIAGFATILHRLNEVYYREKERVHQQELQALAILQFISQPRPANDSPLAPKLIHQAELELQKDFDPVHGGFGNSTKFPNCPTLDFILHSQDTMTKHMALTTLNNMAQGGILDQLEGGFFRYTIDNTWQIPHFEKMLYDNAQLLALYAQAFELTHHQAYRDIAINTGNWLIQTLQEPISKCFYTAIDADTEEKEGEYYLWDRDEIKSALTAHEFSLIKKFFQLDHKANFEDKWHLVIDPQAAIPTPQELTEIKQKLLAERGKRIKPDIDNKILTGWNGLAIKGLSIAGQLLNHKAFLILADEMIKFIRDHLYVDGVLYAIWQNGTPRIAGFLDDYAYLLDAILTFVNQDRAHEYLEFATQLGNDLINNFLDQENGGFFLTAHQAEKMFYRPKIFTDEAVPAGNGIACLALLKLGLLVNNDAFIAAAKKTINCAQSYVNEAPEVHLSMCRAYEFLHSNPGLDRV